MGFEKKFEFTRFQESGKILRGIQIKIISLSTGTVLKLSVVERVRIDCIICRRKEQVALKCWFRWLGFGHIARSCTNANDRSKQCKIFEGKGMSAATLELTQITHCAKEGRV